MVPNTSARWRRGTVQGDGRVGAFASVKEFLPVAFFNKRTEHISGGVRTRIADARMVCTTAFTEEVKEADRFIITQNQKRYRVLVAESSSFAVGYYWNVLLMECPDDNDPDA